VLRIDETAKRLVAPAPETLQTRQLRERQDLQELIVRSWDTFVSELGFPDLRLLGKEVVPHSSCADRIDLLAFDAELGRPVVIELKRDRHRLHLLQGLAYAGMIDTWDDDSYRALLAESQDEDLLNSIENRDLQVSPIVVLIAESFEPEVILATDWLSQKHAVTLYCFSLKLLGFGDDLLLEIQQDYPLKGVHDLYRPRRTVAAASTVASQTWSDVQGWVSYEWGPDMIDRCLATGANHSPEKRYFATPFSGAWGGYMFHVNKRDVVVRFHSRRTGDVDYWQSAIPGAVVTTWGNENTTQGISIPIRSAQQLEQFLLGLAAVPDPAPEDVADGEGDAVV
jgi:hypothetical protein